MATWIRVNSSHNSVLRKLEMNDINNLDRATQIVTAALSGGSHITPDQLRALINETVTTLDFHVTDHSDDQPTDRVDNQHDGQATGAILKSPEPAVAIEDSVTNDYIICLEDGEKLKMLKRHLGSKYDMTPDDYRKRWNLPPDYPMVAPEYSERRRDLAFKIGLGHKPSSRKRKGRTIN
jgi:predicted transcriptional regulator